MTTRLSQGNKAKLPPVATSMSLDVGELLGVTMKLRDLLSKETEYLRSMNVAQLGALQHEKQRLTALLESYKTLLAANPNVLKAMDEATREELAETLSEFSQVVDENYHRVAVARSINQRIVQTILDVVSEQQHAGTYTKRGVAAVPDLTLSFNLNQSA